MDNPFLFKTKAEVVRVIADNCASELIQWTSSCAHQGRTASGTQYHCGTCSQCIDRRVAILSLGLEQHDPDYDYVCDVFTGGRKEGYEQNMAVNFVAHANELNKMSHDQMATRFNMELSRAIRIMDNPTEAAANFIEMHERHAKTVVNVIDTQVARHAPALWRGQLPETSMLALTAGQKHLIDAWQRLATRIIEHLALGVPKACQSVKPKNEPHLQEICDGILQAQSGDLQREFPFMKWSASATKPDWSNESLTLWVELKYVREKKDIRPITEAIAADITKYGDNERHVLYVVYDPEHQVVDEQKFSESIIKHGMLVQFIR